MPSTTVQCGLLPKLLPPYVSDILCLVARCCGILLFTSLSDIFVFCVRHRQTVRTLPTTIVRALSANFVFDNKEITYVRIGSLMIQGWGATYMPPTIQNGFLPNPCSLAYPVSYGEPYAALLCHSFPRLTLDYKVLALCFVFSTTTVVVRVLLTTIDRIFLCSTNRQGDLHTDRKLDDDSRMKDLSSTPQCGFCTNDPPKAICKKTISYSVFVRSGHHIFLSLLLVVPCCAEVLLLQCSERSRAGSIFSLPPLFLIPTKICFRCK